MNHWRTIDNDAPMNGEWVLVWYNHGINTVGIACWDRDYWLDWDGENYGTPTHWMPLPDRPSNG